MSDQKISALTSIAGANIVTSTDIMPIVDTSAAQTKQILVSELLIAMAVPSFATQAQMEQATSTNVYTSPGNEHFHPGVTKAWGYISPPTTVTASYPAAGVSVTNPSTGRYIITHGRTFSVGTNGISFTVVDTTLTIGWSITNLSTTTVEVTFFDTLTQLAKAPNSAFSYLISGDL